MKLGAKIKKLSSIKKAIGVFSIGFLIVFGVISLLYYFYGKSMIGPSDGTGQHIIFLGELRSLLIDRIRHPFATLEMWNWSFGIGSDPIQTLSYYGLGDFISYLIVLFPSQHLESGFVLLMMLRVYLAGVFFILYLKKYSQSSFVMATGAIVYVFSAFVFQFMHPMFMTPLYLFPLILISIDRIFDNRGPVLFSIVVAYTLLNNFYFAYMLAIGALVYLFINYVIVEKAITKKYSFQLVVGGILGALLSSILLLPTLLAFFNSTRVNTDIANGLIVFPAQYYMKLIQAFFGKTNTIGYGLNIGVSTLGVFGITYVYLNRKKEKGLFYTLLLSAAVLAIPFLASVMNGLSSAAHRWSFLLIFIVGVAVTKMLSHLDEVIAHWKNYLLSMCAILAVYWIAPGYSFFILNMMFPLICLLGFYLVLMSQRVQKQAKLKAVYCLVIINVLANGLMHNDPVTNNDIERRQERGQVIRDIQSNLIDAKALSNDGGFYRIGESTLQGNFIQANQKIVENIHGVSSYYSLQNESLGRFREKMMINSTIMTNPLAQLDNRGNLATYLGVKYIMSKHDSPFPVPINYQSDNQVNINGEWYRNDSFLPLISTDNQVYSEEEVTNLNPLQLEQTIVSGTIVEDGNQELTLDTSLLGVNEIDQFSDIEWQAEAESDFELPIKSLNNDVFLLIEGLSFKPQTLRKATIEPSQLRSTLGAYRGQDFTLGIKYKDYRTQIVQYDPTAQSEYDPQSDFLVNIGGSEISSNVKFTSSKSGTYHIKKLSVLSRDNTDFVKSGISNKVASGIKELQLTTNTVSGELTVSSDGVMRTSIPYSNGWQVFIDGEKVPSKRINFSFIGADITEGKHQITLKYQTPGLLKGALLSLLGVIGLLVMWWGQHLRKKRKKALGRDESK